MNSRKYRERSCFLVKFSYEGSGFMGVQEQPGLRTVLGVLRARIRAIGYEARNMNVAARTDRGVHALENYCTFYLLNPCDTAHVANELLKNQGDGLFIILVKQVSPHIHARGNALGKLYRYTVIDNCKNIIQESMAWHIAPVLNVEAMQKAAFFLVGEHDFSSFRGGGCGAKNTVKCIEKIEAFRVSEYIVIIEIEGNGFLRYMIRNITGLLLEVGAGLRSSEQVENILQAKNRLAAGIMAPAHGLCLVNVDFELS